MKGVILARRFSGALVGVTHSVPPFDIAAGAFLLWAGTRHFPAGSVHVAVVDPGVGSERRPVAFAVRSGTVYVGPDNGVFSRVLLEGEVVEVVELRREAAVSPTFEGRDVFAPAAAAIACGARLSDVGTRADEAPLVLARAGHRVVWVDNFGNLVTDVEPPARPLSVGGHEVRRVARTFADMSPGEPFVYVGSMGFLEIGVREARAAEMMAVEAGAAVEVLGS